MRRRDGFQGFCPTPELIRDSELCSVQRVVPGKLVYVAPLSKPESTYVFKLDKVCVLHNDGSLTPYRGEPLSSVGLGIGKKVRVVGMDSPGLPETLVVTEEPAGARTTFGSHSIGEFASRVTGGFTKLWS